MEKTITFSIPCYNSEAYMDRCITSILEGTDYASDVQIIIVDDGSQKDNTLGRAQGWEKKYPEIVKAVHQENKGHGGAVMCALEHAEGYYFKNIDSDDFVDIISCGILLDTLRTFISQNAEVDLVITNYVYDHIDEGKKHTVRYRRPLPKKRIFTWNEMGYFTKWQYLLMHALTYRTEVLRTSGLVLPSHTFYVDNIYAYVPFPHCKKLYYLDTDLYRYVIGREDQSVNEKVLIGRVDHYYRVARVMMKSYHLYSDIPSQKLRRYMKNYLTIIMVICSVIAKLNGSPDLLDELYVLWDELKAFDERMYRSIRKSVLGIFANLPGKKGSFVTITGYRLAQKLVKFN